MNLRGLHRSSAIVVASFAMLHIANHLVSLSGVPAHIAFMESARLVYRNAFVETVLLVCVAFQVVSGLWFLVRGWRTRRGVVARLQAASGAYLAFFLLVHVGAVLFGRAALALDTNFFFAAAGFHVPPYQFFFAPYYFVAVLALFTHLACALYWQLDSIQPARRKLVLAAPFATGALASLLIVMSLAGMFERVDIPARYKATYAFGAT